MITYYDYTEDFQREVERLKRLKRKQQKYLRGIRLGIFLFFLGLGIFLSTFIYPLLFANFLYGAVLMFYGLRKIWRGFINSDLQIAVRLAEKHNWNALAIEKEECSINIGRLKQKVLKSQRDNQSISAEIDPFSYALDVDELHILQIPKDE